MTAMAKKEEGFWESLSDAERKRYGHPGGTCPPERLDDGRPNIEHYRWQLSSLNSANVASVEIRGEPIRNYEQGLTGIIRAAELAGIDSATIMDQRSDADKFLDGISRIIESPESVFELSSKYIRNMISVLDRADEVVAEAFANAASKAGYRAGVTNIVSIDENGKRTIIPKAAATLAAWRKMLQMLAAAQSRVVENHPARTPESMRHTLTAARVLRFMTYVGRPGVPVGGPEAGARTEFYSFGPHHGAMARDLYLALNKCEVNKDGTLTPKGSHPYQGAMFVIAPGHGKTDFACHFWGERLILNPQRQLIIVHAKASQSAKSNQYIQALFGMNYDQGRRARALYPDMVRLSGNGNTQSITTLNIGRKLKQYTITSFGVDAKESGNDATDLWLDDPVDQSEAHQPAERDRTTSRISGTWLTRVRAGENTFRLTTTTLWHPDDANCRRIQRVARGEEWTKVLKMPCGGPDSPEPFKPVWPAVYSAAELKRRFHEMSDRVLWACAYECNPSSETRRLITRVRFYNPESDEHRLFMESARLHLSLDPSATNREGSDKAGGIYAAEGYVRTAKTENNSTVHVTECRLRILDAFAVRATQSELADFCATYCRSHKTDYVHVETRSGFTGTAEMFERLWGVTPIRHDPKNQKKELRLKQAAPYIEDAIGSTGIRAVVEFPGVMGPGGEEPVESIRWAVEQILNFGAHPEEHVVDALTQLVNWLAPSLSIGGQGVATKQFEQTRRVQNAWAEQLKRWSKGVMDLPGVDGGVNLLNGAGLYE